jgi:hypothetical protein
MRVASSNLVEQMEQRALISHPLQQDGLYLLLPLIRELVDDRLTYGCRRIFVLLNRKLEGMGKLRSSKSSAYRIKHQTGCY